MKRETNFFALKLMSTEHSIRPILHFSTIPIFPEQLEDLSSRSQIFFPKNPPDNIPGKAFAQQVPGKFFFQLLRGEMVMDF